MIGDTKKLEQLAKDAKEQAKTDEEIKACPTSEVVLRVSISGTAGQTVRDQLNDPGFNEFVAEQPYAANLFLQFAKCIGEQYKQAAEELDRRIPVP